MRKILSVIMVKMGVLGDFTRNHRDKRGEIRGKRGEFPSSGPFFTANGMEGAAPFGSPLPVQSAGIKRLKPLFRSEDYSASGTRIIRNPVYSVAKLCHARLAARHSSA